MTNRSYFKKGTISFKVIAIALAVCLVLAGIFSGSRRTNKQEAVAYSLPSPTKILPLSRWQSYPVLKGIRIDSQNPLNLEFIIDTASQDEVSKEEASRLIRYFLAGLTLPDEELWVNLSPYEEERVVSDSLALTDLGKDMLGQDYVLKQLLSSLTYPEDKLGKEYWKEVYQEVAKIAGTTNIPINTFNKVWIMPDKAKVYENGNVAFVARASLKCMLEEDYLALKNSSQLLAVEDKQENKEEISKVASKIMKEIVLPKIQEDVSYGKNFATLRQIYHSLILGVWFKQKFKDSFYKHYIDQGKIKGIDLEDKGAKEKIYNLYVEAYKKGVYDYVRQDYDAASQEYIDRRYYSGGEWFGDLPKQLEVVEKPNYVSLDDHIEGKGQWVETRHKPITTEEVKKAANAELAMASSSASSPDSAKAKPKKPSWFRFRLRTLLIGLGLVGILSLPFSGELRRADTLGRWWNKSDAQYEDVFRNWVGFLVARNYGKYPVEVQPLGEFADIAYAVTADGEAYFYKTRFWRGHIEEITSEEFVNIVKEKNLLRDDDIDIRRAAIRALGKTGSQEAIEMLMQFLNDPGPAPDVQYTPAPGELELRSDAAGALGELKALAAVDSLIKGLDDESIYFAADVAEALGKIGDKTALKPLIKVLQSKGTLSSDNMVRRYAAEAVGNIADTEDQEAVDILVQAVENEELYVRLAAIEGLGKIGGNKAREALRQALNDQNRDVRYAAAKALKDSSPKEVLQVLIEISKDESYFSQQLRVESVEALGKSGSKEAKEVLQQLLNDQDAVIRIFAAKALGDREAIRKETERAMQTLKDKSKSAPPHPGPSGGLRGEAAAILGVTGNEMAIPYLVEALTTDDERDVRAAAAWALGQIGSKEAKEALKEALTDIDQKVKAAIIEALGQIEKNQRQKSAKSSSSAGVETESAKDAFSFSSLLQNSANQNNLGGIDFNADQFNIQTQGQGLNLPANIPFNANIEGITFTIIIIEDISDFELSRLIPADKN